MVLTWNRGNYEFDIILYTQRETHAVLAFYIAFHFTKHFNMPFSIWLFEGSTVTEYYTWVKYVLRAQFFCHRLWSQISNIVKFSHFFHHEIISTGSNQYFDPIWKASFLIFKVVNQYFVFCFVLWHWKYMTEFFI